MSVNCGWKKLNNRDNCRYPSEEDFRDKRNRPTLKDLVTSHADSSKWSSYPCKIYKTFDKFGDAEAEVVRILNDAISTADKAGVPENQRPKALRRLHKNRQPPSQYGQSDDESNSSKTGAGKGDAPTIQLSPVPVPQAPRGQQPDGIVGEQSTTEKSAGGEGSTERRSRYDSMTPKETRASQNVKGPPSTRRSKSSQRDRGRSSEHHRWYSVRGRTKSPSLRRSNSTSSRDRKRRRSRHSKSASRERGRSLQRSKSSRSSRERRKSRYSASASTDRSRSRQRSKSRSSRERRKSRHTKSASADRSRSRQRSKSRSSKERSISRRATWDLSRSLTYSRSKSSSPFRFTRSQSKSPSILRSPSIYPNVDTRRNNNNANEQYLHDDVVFQGTVVQGLASTKAVVLKLAKRLVWSDKTPPDREVQVIAERLLVTSLTALQQLDDDVKTDNVLYGKLVAYLSLSGGNDVGSTTRTAFRKLLTDEVQMQFSWEGLKKKRRFDKYTSVLKALYESVRKHFPNATDQSIKTCITVDLRNAKQRSDTKGNEEGKGPC